MRIVIPDDYQDIVRRLDCYPALKGHEVTIHHDTVKGTDALARQLFALFDPVYDWTGDPALRALAASNQR